MFQTRKTNWRTLENTAKIFPATSGREDERVFRFACELIEEIDCEALQKALDQTVKDYPMFLCVLRKGLFWNYLEESALHPVVEEEQRLPCSALYVRDQKNLLFQVSYYKKRINFETYHALTDGTGALHFLQRLIYHYLHLLHPDTVAAGAILESISSSQDDQMEDGFEKYYGSEENADDIPKYKSYQFKYRHKLQRRLKLYEGIIPTSQILKAARERHTTVTVLLTAVYLCAIAKDMKVRQKKRPVALMVPVNLRSYFPSESMRNFFGWIDVGYDFGTQPQDLESVIAYVSEFFKKELQQSRIAARMNNLIKFEKNPIVRILPLELKTLFMKLGARFSSGDDTAAFSNIGRITMSEACGAYIDFFEFYTTTPSMELCMCSFEEKMTLSFTSAYETSKVERNFFSILENMGIEVEKVAGADAPVMEERFPDVTKRNQTHDFWYQLFSFASIALVVLSVMLNWIVTPENLWSHYVAGGTLTAWIVTTVGYRKRRNLLKNALWQLILISSGLILWDYATGWRGWSLDIALPSAIILTLAAMGIIVACFGMDSPDYMIYILICTMMGFLPLLLKLFHLIQFQIPTIICAGISLISLAAVLIFQWSAVKSELTKKFHI
ncbi:MAG: DUF6320 domain-containing protein [Lachnospiraceae bacterium]|nr:DUF6320 domain-containing protein [Lachnospiraceae bacterium]